MQKLLILIALTSLGLVALAQPGTSTGTGPGTQANGGTPQLTPEQLAKLKEQIEAQKRANQRQISDLVTQGIDVRLADIGGFRGARSNKLIGFGIIVGLQGTGDSKSTPFTTTLMANALARWGTQVNEQAYKSKNIAVVSVTAELPPFAAPGRKIDITVSSLGDCSSLQGGTLLPTAHTGLGDPDSVYAIASGSVSIGGFNLGSGGSSVRANHANVGMIPNGADVEKSVATQIVFNNTTMYFDLDEPDFTTAERTATAINAAFSDLKAEAEDGVTIRIEIPAGVPGVLVAKEIENISVKANLPTSVVINERTGTIVIGGDVKLGPAVIAHGSLKVRIDTDYAISQPAPLSNGQTVVVAVPTTQVQDNNAQVAVVNANATVEDLATILQTLKISARDIIAILQALSDQGALKARVIIR